MKTYLRVIRRKMIPQLIKEFDNLFFLTNKGNQFIKISESIQAIADRFTIKTPSAGLHRKVIATEAYKSLDHKSMRCLNTHMTHSEATSIKF